VEDSKNKHETIASQMRFYFSFPYQDCSLADWSMTRVGIEERDGRRNKNKIQEGIHLSKFALSKSVKKYLAVDWVKKRKEQEKEVKKGLQRIESWKRECKILKVHCITLQLCWKPCLGSSWFINVLKIVCLKSLRLSNIIRTVISCWILQ